MTDVLRYVSQLGKDIYDAYMPVWTWLNTPLIRFDPVFNEWLQLQGWNVDLTGIEITPIELVLGFITVVIFVKFIAMITDVIGL